VDAGYSNCPGKASKKITIKPKVKFLIGKELKGMLHCVEYLYNLVVGLGWAAPIPPPIKDDKKK